MNIDKILCHQIKINIEKVSSGDYNVEIIWIEIEALITQDFFKNRHVFVINIKF